MRKEQTPEDAMRDALKGKIFKRKYIEMATTRIRHSDLLDMFVAVAKSEAVREYWQAQQQPKVEIKRYNLKGDLSDQCLSCCNMPYEMEEDAKGEWVKYKEVKPHLQPVNP